MKRSTVLKMFSKTSKIKTRIIVTACDTRYALLYNAIPSCPSSKFMQICLGYNHPFSVMKRTKFFFSTDLTQRNDDSDSEMENSTCEVDSDVEESFQDLQHFLFLDSKDTVTLKLNDCVSVQDVFNVICEYENELNGLHACQALFVLWNLQKVFRKINKERYIDSADSLSTPLSQLIEGFAEKITSHGNFCKVVNVLENSINKLSPDAVTGAFLYLKSMGMPLDRPVMQKLLLHTEALLEDEEIKYPLTALSRFTECLKDLSPLTFVYSVQKALPHIYKYIDTCKNEDEFQLLSVCLQNIQYIITPSNVKAFKNKVNELIEKGILSSFNLSVIVKIAFLFTQSPWNFENSELTKKLLVLLKGKTSDLNKSDVIRVHKIIEDLMEPADLYAELSERASVLLSEEECLSSVGNESFDLLVCVASFCPPKKKKTLEKLTSNYLKQQLNPYSLESLFKILRYLKSSDIKLYEEYWSRTLEVMKMYPQEYSYKYIGKYANRYMFFNNNLSGTFRHSQFENQLIEWYFQLYNTGVIRYIPSLFSRMIGFFVAYGDNQNRIFFLELELMIKKLEEMSSQLAPVDCSNLSRGIQVNKQLRMKNYDRSHMYNIHVQLNSILNICARKHFEMLYYNISFTNLLMKSYVGRKEPHTTDISQNLVERYEKSVGPIDSRSLRTAVHNFRESKCLIPKTIDQFTEYVEENGSNVFGKTVELILSLCLFFGYSPSNANSFLEVASNTIVRDLDRMTGLSVLNSCLALCFFHSLPKELVNFIFTIDFLESLDLEIANCYAKAVYPARVRNYLMQVNRAVCLDYPEFDIPWFHQKYCEEKAATDVIRTSAFHDEVKETLMNILGEKNLIRQHSYSSYGYRLDFELFFNENNVPVSWRRKYDKNILRKAVLLLSEDAFTNNVKSLNGYAQLKKRHLEMLGYDVIEVEQTVWNAMYMSEPQMKHNFMKENLFKDDKEAIKNELNF